MSISGPAFLSIVLSSCLSASLAAQSPERLLWPASAQSQGHSGAAVITISDFNGDGVRDLAIGADRLAGSVTGAIGAVAFYDGRFGGSPIPVTPATNAGGSLGDDVGASLADLGILGGDSLVAVGAPRADSIGMDAGRVVILTAPQGNLLVAIDGPSAGARFGQAMATVGDLDGDGAFEFAVGAPLASAGGASAGRVELRNGATGALIWWMDGSPGAELGSALDGGADFNGDGIPDLLVGAPRDSTTGTTRGRVFVLSGAGGGILATVSGVSNGDTLGRAVAFAPDMDGDGRPEIVAGAPWDDEAGLVNVGTVTVFSSTGLLPILSLRGEFANDEFGRAVDAANVDHDGIPDILVGAPLADRGAPDIGVAYAFSGRDGHELWRETGRCAGDEFGHLVVDLGAKDGTAVSEFAVSAWKEPALNVDGAGWVYTFTRLGEDQRRRLTRIPQGDHLTALDDLDGDLAPEVALRQTAGLMLPPIVSTSVRLVSPRTGRSFWTIFPDETVREVGAWMARIDDCNDDAVRDLAIGCPDAGGGATGEVRIVSGVDGSPIATIPGLSREHGRLFVTRGDTDMDLEPEVVVATPSNFTGGVWSGPIHLNAYNAITGTSIWFVSPPGALGRPAHFEAMDDLDGDGFDDYLLAYPQAFGGTSGEVYLVSGFNGFLIRSHIGAPGEHLGAEVLPWIDLDGDGVRDYGLSAATAPTTSSVTTRFYSGATGALLPLSIPGIVHPAGADLTGDLKHELIGIEQSPTFLMTLRDGVTGLALQTSPGLPSAAFYGVQFARGYLAFDANEDNYPDLVRPGPGVSILGDVIAPFHGAVERGADLAGPRALELNLVRNGLPTRQTSTLVVSNGGPFATGVLAAALVARSTDFGGYLLHIQPTEPSLALFSIAFDAFGLYSLTSDLDIPGLEGVTLHLQAVEFAGNAEYPVLLSEGMSITFCEI